MWTYSDYLPDHIEVVVWQKNHDKFVAARDEIKSTLDRIDATLNPLVAEAMPMEGGFGSLSLAEYAYNGALAALERFDAGPDYLAGGISTVL